MNRMNRLRRTTKQKVREDFYEALQDFSLCLKVALGSASFYEEAVSARKISRLTSKTALFHTDHPTGCRRGRRLRKLHGAG